VERRKQVSIADKNIKIMKVVAINGSPRKEGNTYHALKIVCEQLEAKGIETEIIQVGIKNVKACTACGMCAKNRDEKCVIKNDPVNDWIQVLKQADGILLGSPVHYAALGAGMKSFLDRVFYVSGVNGNLFRHKVGASLAAVRRSGGLPTFNEMNNYLNYTEMMIPTSNYWNVIHGTSPGEVHQDEEGIQIMRVLGKNMAYLLQLMEYGKGKIEAPPVEKKTFTNFIR
jgi:multimeric flavodoxin WrbA